MWHSEISLSALDLLDDRMGIQSDVRALPGSRSNEWEHTFEKGTKHDLGEGLIPIVIR